MKSAILIIFLWINTFNLAQAKMIPIAKSQCEQDYLELFKNDTIKMTIAYGYDNLSPVITNDSENLKLFIKTMSTPCGASDQKACGFQVKNKNPYVLTRKLIGPDGKSRTLEITANAPSMTSRNDLNTKNPLQPSKSEKVRQMFLDGLESDDVIIYMGHSRDGGGPDFFPPKLKSNGHVDYDWYHENPDNKNEMLRVLKNNPNRPRIVSLLSCSSIRWFSKGIQKSTPASGVIGTNKDYVSFTFSEVFPLIENIFSYQCLEKLTIQDIKKSAQISVNKLWEVPKKDQALTNQSMDKKVLNNLVVQLRSFDINIRKDAYFEIMQFDAKLITPKMLEEIDAYKMSIEIRKALN